MSCCGFRRSISEVTSKAKQAIDTTTSVIKHAAESGQLLADDGLIKKRKNICETCSHKSGSGHAKRCQLCGCFIALKTGLVAASCPAKKW
jgi:hypothetical protein